MISPYHGYSWLSSIGLLGVSLDKVLWQATIVAVAVSSVMGEDAWMVAVVGIIHKFPPE